MGKILRNSANVHDQDTGELVGYVNPITGREVAATSLTAEAAAAVQALVSGAGNSRQRPRIGVCGTSITHTVPARASTGVANNGDGTWNITFGSSPRPDFGEGDTPLINVGPLGINTRQAEVLSISGNTMTVRPNAALALPATLVGTNPNVHSAYSRNYASYPIYAEYMSRCGAVVTVDAAIAGADTQQLLTIIDRDLVARASEIDAVVAEIGSMNGVYARNNSYATEMAYVIDYVNKIAAMGKPFLIVGVAPRGSASVSWTLAKAKIAAKINAYLQPWVISLGGSFLNPARVSFGAKTYLSPTDTNGGCSVPEASTDGVHPNSGGGPMLGYAVSNWLDSVFRPVDILPASVLETEGGMLNTNPLMQGTAGTLSGGVGATVSGFVATGCDLAVESGGADCNVACEVLARSEAVHGDALGNVQRLVITTGATVSTTVRFEFVVAAAAAHALVTNGDRVQGVCSIVTSGGASPGVGAPVGLASVNPALLISTATTGNQFCNGNGAGTAAVNQEAVRLRAQTAVVQIRGPLAVHGAPNVLRARVVIYLRANASACIDIGRCGLLKIAA